MPVVRFLPDEQTVEVGEGETLLDAAIRSGIPATHACGGEGRCSTCRVLVLEGAEHLGPIGETERGLLEPLGLDRPLRLACQVTPAGPVTVRRLVLDPEDEVLTDQRRKSTQASRVGVERRVAILFADIRGFTAFAEPLLPYDVVHVLNRFFGFAGGVVESHRGRIATYLGDGFMAIFGVEDAGVGPPQPAVLPDRLSAHLEAPRNAVQAGIELLAEVDDFQAYLKRLHGGGFGVSIGVHYGDAVVGAVGTRDARAVTAIGDAVNTAARVEWANRVHGTRMLVTAEIREAVGDAFSMREKPPIDLPGKSGRHVLWEVAGRDE